MDFSSIIEYLGNCERKCETTYCNWLDAKRRFQEERRKVISVWRKALKQLVKEGQITYDPEFDRYNLDQDCTMKLMAPVYHIYVTESSSNITKTLGEARFDSSFCSRHPEAEKAFERFIKIISEAD